MSRLRLSSSSYASDNTNNISTSLCSNTTKSKVSTTSRNVSNETIYTPSAFDATLQTLDDTRDSIQERNASYDLSSDSGNEEMTAEAFQELIYQQMCIPLPETPHVLTLFRSIVRENISTPKNIFRIISNKDHIRMQSRGKIKRKKYSITFKKIKPVPKPKQKSTMRNLVYNL